VSEEPGTFEGKNALINTNIGKAYLFGFEYSFNYSFTNKLNFYNTLSFVRGINQLDNSSLPEIAPLNGIVGLKFLPYNFLSADFSAVVFAEQNKVAQGELKTPGYAYFNFSLDFMNVEISKIKLNISAGVENLLNKEYRNHLSTIRGLVVYEPGRNFYLRTNIAF
jgi:outer membrane receptor protein involved in Fe transport